MDEFETYEEAENKLNEWEAEDKIHGEYTPDFYEICEVTDAKQDYYTYYGCSSGSCPRLVEEEIYGKRTYKCSDYCGDPNEFTNCDSCLFTHSDLCEKCIHYKLGGGDI